MGRSLVLGVIVAGCSLWPGGISADQAIRAALDEARMRNPVVVVVREGRLADLASDGVVFGSAEEMQRQVWAVTLRGEIETCMREEPPVQPPQCMRRAGTMIVFVDRETGLVTAVEAGAAPNP